MAPPEVILVAVFTVNWRSVQERGVSVRTGARSTRRRLEDNLGLKV